MEALDARAEAVGRAADLAEREQPGIAEERGVFEPLRLHRRCELLERHHRAARGAGRRRGERIGRGVERRGVRVDGEPARDLPRASHDAARGRVEGVLAVVGPIHGEGGEERAHGGGERFGGRGREGGAARAELAGGGGERPVQTGGGGVELHAQRAVRDLAPARERELAVRALVARERPIQPRQRALGVRVDEQAAHVVEEVVAGGAVARPGRRQVLVALEDLLYRDIRRGEPLAHALQVPGRVGEPVRVVDAQTLHRSVGDEPPRQRVDAVEDRGVLDAQADEVVDQEEAAIVHALLAREPVLEAVVLPLEERRESRGRRRGGVFRAQRQTMLEVAQPAAVRIALDGELAARHHRSGFVAEDRQDDAPVQRGVRRLPVDVEERRVRRVAAAPQHVLPPGVAAGGHAHVVRHDVDDLAQAEPPLLRDEPRVRRFAAELGVEPLRIDDVVAVRAAGRCRRDRREVDVRDAEVAEVGEDGGGVVEGEAGVQLEPVGGGDRCDRARSPARGRSRARHADPPASSGAPPRPGA